MGVMSQLTGQAVSTNLAPAVQKFSVACCMLLSYTLLVSACLLCAFTGVCYRSSTADIALYRKLNPDINPRLFSLALRICHILSIDYIVAHVLVITPLHGWSRLLQLAVSIGIWVLSVYVVISCGIIGVASLMMQSYLGFKRERAHQKIDNRHFDDSDLLRTVVRELIEYFKKGYL